METLVLTEVRNQIAYITINRPQQLNALNKDTIAALHDALAAANDEVSVRAIILTGSGEKAFVAGADIKEFALKKVECSVVLATSYYLIL